MRPDLRKSGWPRRPRIAERVAGSFQIGQAKEKPPEPEEPPITEGHAAWARQGRLAFPLFATQAMLAGTVSPGRRAILANLSEALSEEIHSPTPRAFEAELDRPPVDVTQLTQLTGKKPPKRVCVRASPFFRRLMDCVELGAWLNRVQ
jgi:hypothetical protein